MRNIKTDPEILKKIINLREVNSDLPWYEIGKRVGLRGDTARIMYTVYKQKVHVEQERINRERVKPCKRCKKIFTAQHRGIWYCDDCRPKLREDYGFDGLYW